jgi:hypothetical protein
VKYIYFFIVFRVGVIVAHMDSKEVGEVQEEILTIIQDGEETKVDVEGDVVDPTTGMHPYHPDTNTC